MAQVRMVALRGLTHADFGTSVGPGDFFTCDSKIGAELEKAQHARAAKDGDDAKTKVERAGAGAGAAPPAAANDTSAAPK